jgi:exonuclease III
MGLEPGSNVAETQTPRILRVASWNISGVVKENLLDMCTYLINQADADVIALQGVVYQTFEPIFRAFKTNGYTSVRPDQIPDRKDTELLFSRLPVVKKMYKRFANSTQNRGTLAYQVQVGGKTPVEVWVCTSQLEATGAGNGPRKLQIHEIPKIFSKEHAVIFAGDTNVPSWQDTPLPEGWHDAWREKGSSDTEKTTTEDRKDRVMYTSDLRCIHFDLVCKSESRRGVVASFVC